MKVIEHASFDPQFPENFIWGQIESHNLTALAEDCAKQIKIELEQPPGNRVNVAGLRFALVRMSNIATL